MSFLNGASINTRSKDARECASSPSARRTSETMIRPRSVRSSCARLLRIAAAASRDESTKVTCDAPRESDSIPSEPLPAKISSTRASVRSVRTASREKIDSRARLEVANHLADYLDALIAGEQRRILVRIVSYRDDDLVEYRDAAPDHIDVPIVNRIKAAGVDRDQR